MKANQYLEQSMEEEQLREALNAHWHASAAGRLLGLSHHLKQELQKLSKRHHCQQEWDHG